MKTYYVYSNTLFIMPLSEPERILVKESILYAIIFCLVMLIISFGFELASFFGFYFS